MVMVVLYSGLLFSLILFTVSLAEESSTSSQILNTIASNNDNSSNYDKSSEWRQTLPDAIIIGAKKCGTRALLKFIGTHPNVSIAGAEVHFFDRFYHMGLDWYR